MWSCQSSPVNFYKPLQASSHFSWANHKRWRGQRALLDVLQLPMGNVSPSHRQGITNSLLSVLTSDGGCSKLTPPPSIGNYAWREKEPPATWEMSHLVLEDILTRVYYIFHCISQVIQSTSRVLNRKGVTLFTFSLTSQHPTYYLHHSTLSGAGIIVLL